MIVFDRTTLESHKYADLVKLAKEYDVYRRYAPKTELIEKLMAKNEVETLSDVSMPSFMEQEGEDIEAKEVVQNFVEAKGRILSSFSPSPASICKSRSINMKTTPAQSASPLVISKKSNTPRNTRRSLAGPANIRLSRQISSETEGKIEKENARINRRVTRQQTESVIVKKKRVKREGTFDVNKDENTNGPMRREGTFDIQEKKANKKGQIKRERTFDVDTQSTEEHESNKLSGGPRSQKFKRQGTFEIVTSSFSPTTEVLKNTPVSKLRASIATPVSVKTINKTGNGSSVPQRVVAPLMRKSMEHRNSATKSKIPSLIIDNQKKKAEASAKKLAVALGGDKQKQARKAPDFQAIHKRLFNNMESLIDSRQKVIDRANSVHKNEYCQRDLPKTKVVRKLLSPKIGKPKPFQHKASAYTSNIVSIQRRPSVGSSIPGVAKLPKLQTTASRHPKTEPTRYEAMKASVLGRKPIKKSSPMAKAKQALQTVRLNKRFELQMKHRFAQQSS